LNAKKLDVNFDNDDFFNSFEPTTKPAVEEIPSKNKFVTKLQEVKDENTNKLPSFASST